MLEELLSERRHSLHFEVSSLSLSLNPFFFHHSSLKLSIHGFLSSILASPPSLMALAQFLSSYAHRCATTTTPSQLSKSLLSFHSTLYLSCRIPFRYHSDRSSRFYHAAIAPQGNAGFRHLASSWSTRVCSILPTLHTPALQALDGRSYSTAEAEMVLGEELSYQVEEGVLEAKQQEVDSLRSNIEELNKEIEKLKERLAAVEKFEEENKDKKVESQAAPPESRSKQETIDGAPSLLTPSAAEAEAVKQMTLETLGVAEEKPKRERRAKQKEGPLETVDKEHIKAEDGGLKKSKSKSASSSARRRSSSSSSEEKVEAEYAQEVEHSPEKIHQVTMEVSEIVAGSSRKKPTNESSLSVSQKQLTEEMSGVVRESSVSDSGSSILKNETAIIEEEESGIAAELQFGHPWPEWIAFLEHLEKNDFFKEDDQRVSERENLFNDASSIKHAVIAFGRERDDIFRLLSKKDIKVVANFGCPNTERKAVNGAKRLRVLCNITEGEVCQQCRLKKSCVRAFTQPASDVAAGTLDVVRVLFPYALNALPNAESHESYPEYLKNSICNLLKQLVQLSMNPRDPELPKPESSPIIKKQFDSERAVQNPGGLSAGFAAYTDWTCSNCDYTNFGRNKLCRACGSYRPSKELKPGDWLCPDPRCRFSNFAKNIACLKCETERPACVERMKDGFHERSRRANFEEDYNGGRWHGNKSTSRRADFEEDYNSGRGHSNKSTSRRADFESRRADFEEHYDGGRGHSNKSTSRRRDFEEDYDGGRGRGNKSTSIPRKNEDGLSLREWGSKSKSTALDYRGGTQHRKHEEWKPVLRKEPSDDENDIYANLGESEKDAATSNFDMVDELELNDVKESGEEDDAVSLGLVKGVKKTKRPSTRWSSDMSDDGDNDTESDGGSDRKGQTERGKHVAGRRNKARGRRANVEQR